MRRPGRIDHPAQQEQTAPLDILCGIEDDIGAVAVVSLSRVGGNDRPRPDPIGSRGKIQRVQALEIVAIASLLIASTNMVPFVPSARSMTGVAVMPISGVTWPQPWSSEGVSPARSIEALHSKLLPSASKA